MNGTTGTPTVEKFKISRCVYSSFLLPLFSPTPHLHSLTPYRTSCLTTHFQSLTRTYVVSRFKDNAHDANSPQLMEKSLVDTDQEVAQIMASPAAVCLPNSLLTTVTGEGNPAST